MSGHTVGCFIFQQTFSMGTLVSDVGRCPLLSNRMPLSMAYMCDDVQVFVNELYFSM